MNAQAKPKKTALSWLLWGGLTLAASAALGQKLVSPQASKDVFLPGETTSGHYQIELECGACHKDDFASSEDIQAACVGCHGGELDTAGDAHPKSKFTDPRNASRVALLDARECVTCHAEHLPDQTRTMGLTLPEDYCFHCHQEILEERPSHAGLPFDSCDDSGCHNFHDNRALYEDFLVEHGQDAWLTATPVVPVVLPLGAPTGVHTASEADLVGGEPSHAEHWAQSAHARAGVKCSACHTGDRKAGSEVPEAPLRVCGECHETALSGWLAGRHGMRVAQGLAPMVVRQARSEMRSQAAHLELLCSSCHGDHGTDRERARFEACVSCHSGEHTEGYEGSPHHRLLMLEREGKIAKGGGVSCATCHLPAMSRPDGTVTVEHNQNANLRPSDKMIRTACQACHGLPFAIDALADRDLVQKNFWGRPSLHVKSVDWALAREQ